MKFHHIRNNSTTRTSQFSVHCSQCLQKPVSGCYFSRITSTTMQASLWPMVAVAATLPYTLAGNCAQVRTDENCQGLGTCFMFFHMVIHLEQGKKVCKAAALRSCHCFPCTMLPGCSRANWLLPEKKKSYSALLLTAADRCNYEVSRPKSLRFEFLKSPACLKKAKENLGFRQRS